MDKRVLLLGLLCLLGAAAPETAAPSVTVVPAQAGSLVATVLVTGTLVPREDVLISPQIDGLAMTSINVEEGDHVAAGQVLATLSHEALDASLAQNTAQQAKAEAAIAQAQSAIAEAQASRQQADAAFARAKDLVVSGTTSRETFDTRQQAAQVSAARLTASVNALHAAEADAALTRAQRQELQVRLDRTSIRAPVAGVVSRRTARLGAVVGMTGEPLFRLIAGGAVELEAAVPETRLAQLRPGQSAVLTVGDTTIPAHVRLVAPEISQVSRLGRVRIAPDTDGAPAAIGSFARATVEVARQSGFIVPLSAVLFDPDGTHVQVVQNGTVQTRTVTVGLRNAGQALLSGGVQAGETVVAVSGTFVRDGDRVTPVPASGPAAGG
ncbi:efflux RND transporter periplasmic adaptor subunit [Acidisphaera sp. L21]|uniref:efflux RND transporter periplasmic adaptor subunit n=1 Tax=Acidisphaera sp. L21 TaxID=1641851 RepID=UPI00131B2AF3|nr:efflux RND transporter periplasmic adaptor subunit [Acidisphaera sp. L21]